MHERKSSPRVERNVQKKKRACKMTITLNPCPFCKKEDNLEIVQNDHIPVEMMVMRTCDNSNYYAVRCENCGATGPIGSSLVETIELWNKANEPS